MNSEQMRKSWNGMSEEIMSGIAEWRQQHPQATFRELEEEVDRRLAVMRTKGEGSLLVGRLDHADDG